MKTHIMFKRGKFIATIFIAMLILTSCSNVVNNFKTYKFNPAAKYVLLSVENVNFNKERPTLHFYDEKGKEIDKVTYEDAYDMSYRTAKKDAVYFHGPGGVLKVDLVNHEVKKIIHQGSIDDIEYSDNDELYYYHNIGKPNSMSEYKSKICKFEGECFDFKLPISSFAIKDNLLYVFHSTDVGDDAKESYFVIVDMNTKKEIHRELKSIYSVVFKSQGKIYFSNQDYIYSLDDSFKYQYTNSTYNLYYDYSNIYVAYPYKENQIILKNIITNKDLIIVEDKEKFKFIIDEKTQRVLQHFFKNKHFIDHSTNIKVETPDRIQYGVFYLK